MVFGELLYHCTSLFLMGNVREIEKYFLKDLSSSKCSTSKN
jgi:hypothetical protein